MPSRSLLPVLVMDLYVYECLYPTVPIMARIKRRFNTILLVDASKRKGRILCLKLCYALRVAEQVEAIDNEQT